MNSCNSGRFYNHNTVPELPELTTEQADWFARLADELETGKPTYTERATITSDDTTTSETPAITADEAVDKFSEALERRLNEGRDPDEA